MGRQDISNGQIFLMVTKEIAKKNYKLHFGNPNGEMIKGE
jgi:hypothetical protein